MLTNFNNQDREVLTKNQQAIMSKIDGLYWALFVLGLLIGIDVLLKIY